MRNMRYTTRSTPTDGPKLNAKPNTSHIVDRMTLPAKIWLTICHAGDYSVVFLMHTLVRASMAGHSARARARPRGRVGKKASDTHRKRVLRA